MAELPSPYNTVRLRPYNLVTDWFAPGNSRALAYLMSAYQVKTIIELGTWMGASAIQMARMLPDDGVLYAIDTYGIVDTLSHEVGTLYQIKDED